MSKAIDVARFTPPEPLTAEQQSYIHGGRTAPWQAEAYDWFWSEYPQHRAHYLKAYKYFKNWSVRNTAATNRKRLAGKPAPEPEVNTKLRNV